METYIRFREVPALSLVPQIKIGLEARWRELCDLEVIPFLFFHPKTFGDPDCVGMVMTMGCEDSIKFARNANFPIINVSELLPPIDFVHNVRYDNFEIAKLAVNHLWDMGYRKFLFLEHFGAAFSEQRKCAFHQILRERGCLQVMDFQLPIRRYVNNQKNQDLAVAELKKILPDLGTNVGVFAANDTTARFFVEALNALDPDIVSAYGVVGVDDEYGRSEKPTKLIPLTSILPNFQGIGKVAAEKLYEFITSGKKPCGEVTRVSGAKLIPRLTTSGIIAEDVRVAKISRWIYNEVECGNAPSVVDVAVAFKMSERMLYDLFRKEYEGSIRDFIMSTRIQKAAKMLISTDASISEIAQSCAFNKHADLSERFQKYMGCTPSEYRKSKAEQHYKKPV